MLKLSSFFCLFFLFSCTKLHNTTVVIKVGPKSWTLKEVQNYFQLRTRTSSREEQNPKALKKELLNEILLQSLVENWAKKNQIQIKKISLTEEEKRTFSNYNNQKEILRKHKVYLQLYKILLEKLSKQLPDPALKIQKQFYNKNKALFLQPPSCYLKQVLVKEKTLAQTLQKKLKQKENFELLSRIHSIQKHPGWIEKNQLKVFDQACFEQKNSPNSILKSPYGYHIFRVEKRKPGQQKQFKQVQKQIIRTLKSKKTKEQFQIWLKQEIFKTPVWTDKKLLDTIHIQHKTRVL